MDPLDFVSGDIFVDLSWVFNVYDILEDFWKVYASQICWAQRSFKCFRFQKARNDLNPNALHLFHGPLSQFVRPCATRKLQFELARGSCLRNSLVQNLQSFKNTSDKLSSKLEVARYSIASDYCNLDSSFKFLSLGTVVRNDLFTCFFHCVLA
jgi:hypothetical protein